MLRRVVVSGFKAIPPVGIELELRPLTLLVGPNGSGKSSVLQAIGVLAQSVRSGTHVQLTTAGRLVNVVDDTPDPLAQVALVHGLDPNGSVEVDLAVEIKGRVVEFGFTASSFGRGLGASFVQRFGIEIQKVLFDSAFSAAGRGARAVLLGPEVRDSASVQGDLQRLLDPGLFSTREHGVFVDLRAAADEIAGWLTSSALRYQGEWRGTSLVAGVQANPSGQNDVAGQFGENIHRMFLSAGARSEKMRLAKEAAAAFGLDGLEFNVERGALTASFADPYTRTRVELRQAGSASRHTLPVLADLFDLPRGGTLLVDELEGGAHPSWMRAWGATLATATSRGIQVIVTAQSPDLATAVALAVKQGKVSPDDVVVHDFARSKDGLSTTQYTVDARGRFSPGFIASYAEAERNLLGQVLAWDGEEEVSAAPPKAMPKRKPKPAARRSRS